MWAGVAVSRYGIRGMKGLFRQARKVSVAIGEQKGWKT
jgi:hypothetical protein